MANPLRKVLAAEIDCSMRDGGGFAALLWLECGHAVYTERRDHIDEQSGYVDVPEYLDRTLCSSKIFNRWKGGRKRCPHCGRGHFQPEVDDGK